MAPYKCFMCWDDYDDNTHVALPADGENQEDNIACLACFQADYKERFEEAIKHEWNYPVRHGAVILDPRTHFRDGLFDAAFLERWRLAKREYGVSPAKMRVYCPSCKKFAFKWGEGSPGTRPVSCPHCYADLCGRCGKLRADRQAPLHNDSDCGPDPATVRDEPPDSVRGRDHQYCPSCAQVGFLGEACNAIVCPKCHTHYCYICGIPAHHDGYHWQRANPCPKWNQPGADSANYDPEDRKGLIAAGREPEAMYRYFWDAARSLEIYTRKHESELGPRTLQQQRVAATLYQDAVAAYKFVSDKFPQAIPPSYTDDCEVIAEFVKILQLSSELYKIIPPTTASDDGGLPRVATMEAGDTLNQTGWANLRDWQEAMRKDVPKMQEVAKRWGATEAAWFTHLMSEWQASTRLAAIIPPLQTMPEDSRRRSG
ncbi:hypothetical protein LTR62_003259 [Meristemomyces frigidus]|uniref:RING-type domain-containing protein n=1 Tax=Meristemomyces frigidus TaxID=1508187 RepID=A0AAN7TLD1_9PEZI|nr:hypothetical protein LTR62_003259 [Meristemomyces frigidus]